MAEKWEPMKVKLGAIIPIILSSLIHNIKLLLVGDPGIGKTAVCDAAFATLPPYIQDGDSAVILRWFFAQEQAEDVAGLPAKTEDEFGPFATHLLFGKQRVNVITKDRYIVNFLDDCGMGMTRDQTAQMQFLRGFIQGEKLPDNVRFIGATNDKTDKAGVVGMISPFKSSFDCIYHVEEDFDLWRNWAESSEEIRPDILAYLRDNPYALNQFIPSTDLVNWPNPRTWHSASKMLNICEANNAPNYVQKASVEGAIGAAQTAQFFAFKSMLDSAVTPTIILHDPIGANVPDNASVLYAVSLSLIHAVDTLEKGEIAMSYAARIPAEFEALIMKRLVGKNPALKNTDGYIKFKARHAEIML